MGFEKSHQQVADVKRQITLQPKKGCNTGRIEEESTEEERSSASLSADSLDLLWCQRVCPS